MTTCQCVVTGSGDKVGRDLLASSSKAAVRMDAAPVVQLIEASDMTGLSKALVLFQLRTRFFAGEIVARFPVQCVTSFVQSQPEMVDIRKSHYNIIGMEGRTGSTTDPEVHSSSVCALCVCTFDTSMAVCDGNLTTIAAATVCCNDLPPI